MDQQQHKKLLCVLDAAWERIKPKKRSEGGNELPGFPEILEDGPHWLRSLTDPLPAAWPPPENLTLYYYAYAIGHDQSAGIHDGVHVSSPWARIEVLPRNDSMPNLTWLSDGA